MKQFIIITAIALATMLTGCSSLYNSTPEFSSALDAKARVDHLAGYARGAERVSQIDAVNAGQPFMANCETWARTLADLLIQDVADPADVALVIVKMKPNRPGKTWYPEDERHMLVEYKGMLMDRSWPGLLAYDDLEYEYDFQLRQSMAGGGWQPHERRGS
jgi:hypothetical protein